MNHKRVHRLCRRDGLRVPRENRSKRRLGVSSNGIERRKAMHRNDVWCWDFVEDSDFLAAAFTRRTSTRGGSRRSRRADSSAR